MVTYIANGLLLAIPGIQAISQRVYTVMMGLPSIGAVVVLAHPPCCRHPLRHS